MSAWYAKPLLEEHLCITREQEMFISLDYKQEVGCSSCSMSSSGVSDPS
jgi:hypothetical protein